MSTNGKAPDPQLQLRRYAVADLQQDPRNARTHDRANIDAIKASLQRFGQVLPVVVRHGQLVGGNATTIAADELGWTHLDGVPADDLSEEEATRLAIALNRTAELAGWDRPVLVEHLLSFGDDLDGLGFTGDDLAQLEAGLKPFDPHAEWQGMPEFEAQDLGSVFHCIVHFPSDADADRFFQLIGKPKRRSLWWPAEPDDHQGSDIHAAYVAADPSANGDGPEP